MPVKPVYRVIALIAIVGFNVIRMRIKKKGRIQESGVRYYG
jgi:hypothetical protein